MRQEKRKKEEERKQKVKVKTATMMMMKPLFKCHKILVHYSTNWGH